MKPPYVVPSMKEIEKIKNTNGYTVVSTFSGCGGACLGFEMDGYEILYANEFVEQARITYAANHPTVHLDGRDIRTVTGEDILKRIGKEVGEIDLLEGSPPCASFSTAGSRDKGWGKNKKYSDTTQRADDLFFEYSRIVGQIQPKVFTAENVSGLVKGKAIGYFKDILTDLREQGYVVEAKVLDASWLGVPQARQRLIFIGVRKDLAEKFGLRPVFPKPMSYQYTIRDVLPNMESVVHDTGGQFGIGDVTDRPVNTITTANSHWNVAQAGEPVSTDPETNTDIVFHRDIDDEFIVMQRGKDAKRRARSNNEPAPTIAAHGLGNVNQVQAGVRLPKTRDEETGDDLQVSEYITHDQETGQDVRINGYAIGPEWDKLLPGEQSKRYFQLVKANVHKPIGTITATAGGVGAAGTTHPTQRRKFTLQELRLLSSFPSDFILTGNYAQRWERIGRSVPPLMARSIAHTIRTEILDKIK